MGKARIEKRKKMEVKKGRKGRPSTYPAVNLTGSGYRTATLEGNGWDKYYKKALAKLAQDISEEQVEERLGPRAHIDESIKSVLNDIADIYEIQNPNYFGPREEGGVGLDKESWIEAASKRPMYAGDVIRSFGQRTGQSAFETLGSAMMFDPLAQSHDITPDSVLAEKSREFSSTLSELDAAGNVAAVGLARSPFLSFLANFGVPAGSVAFMGDVKEEQKTPHNRRPGLAPYVDLARAQAKYVKSNALLDELDQTQREQGYDPEEVTRARTRLAEGGYGGPEGTAQLYKDQRLVAMDDARQETEQQIQESIGAINQAVETLPDRTAVQKAISQRQAQESEELVKRMLSQGSNWALAPRVMPAVSVLNDLGLMQAGMDATTGQEVAIRGQKDWQLLNINSEPTSLIGEVGDRTLMEPISGRSGKTYDPGTELTPEITEDLKAAGIDKVMAAHSPTWGQLAARYGDTAVTAFAESVMAQKANRLGREVGSRIKQLPGVQKALKGIQEAGGAVSRATGIPKAMQGAKSLGGAMKGQAGRLPRRASELTKSVVESARTGRAAKAMNKALQLVARGGRASRLGPLTSVAAGRLSRMAQSPSTLKALRGLRATSKVLGPLAGLGAGAWDVYEGLSPAGQRRIEQALEKRWLDEYHSGGMVGLGQNALRDIASLPEAAFWDPTHFQAMLADNPGLTNAITSSASGGLTRALDNSGYSMDPSEARDLAKQQFLSKYKRAREMTQEYSDTYTQLAEALPNVGPQTLAVLANNAAYSRVQTRHGEAPKDREVSQLQHDLVEHIEGQHGPQAASRAQELMRLVGDETFVQTFIAHDAEGQPRLNPVMMESLTEGAEAPIPSAPGSWRNPFRREKREISEAGKEFQKEQWKAEHEEAVQQRQAEHVQEMKRIRQQQEDIRRGSQESEQRYQTAKQELRGIREQRQLAQDRGQQVWERIVSPEARDRRLATLEAQKRRSMGLPAREPLQPSRKVPQQPASLGAALTDDYEQFLGQQGISGAPATSVDQPATAPQNVPTTVGADEVAQTLSRLKSQGVIGG